MIESETIAIDSNTCRGCGKQLLVDNDRHLEDIVPALPVVPWTHPSSGCIWVHTGEVSPGALATNISQSALLEQTKGKMHLVFTCKSDPPDPEGGSHRRSSSSDRRGKPRIEVS